MTPTRRLRAALAATLGAVALSLVATAAPASAEVSTNSLPPDGTYVISPDHSGYCLGVAGGSLADGAQVVQYACNGRTSQQWWLFRPRGADGWVAFQNIHSGKCMNVKGDTDRFGAPIVQYRCTYNRNELFLASRDNPGSILTYFSGCLDIKGASQALGAQLDQYGCTGRSNQTFSFSPR